MRLGLIGLGRIGVYHAGILLGLGGDEPLVDELVVVDAVPGRAGTVATELGARVRGVDTPDQLFAAVDGVVVAAATDAHPSLIAAAVDAGVPVLCEKPLAGSIGEARAVASAVGGRGVPVTIGYQRRFDVGYGAARAAVLAGDLGHVHTVRATTLDPAPPPAAYIAVSGGIWRDCSVHDLDIVRWVLGQEVVSVFATGTLTSDAREGASTFADADDVDTAAAVLTMSDGTLALVSNARYNARGYDCRLEVLGTRDSVSVGLEDKMPLRSVEPGVAFPTGTPWDFFVDRFAPAYVSEMTQFLDVVAGRAEAVCPPADALETAYVAEACTLSRRLGRPVTIEEVRT